MLSPTELSIAITAALATFFSPCAYALLPGYVGYTVHRTASAEQLQSFVLRGIVAGAGVLVVLGGASVLFVSVGIQIIDGVDFVEPVVGILIAAFGLLLVFDRIPSLHIQLPQRPASLAGFGLFGGGYALAAVGCSLPVFVGVLGVASTASTTAASAMIGIYVGLVVLLMVAATIAAGIGADSLLSTFSTHGRILQQLAGIVLFLGGVGQIYIAFTF